MTDNAMLDAIIAREEYAAMLHALTPKQLAVAALRLEGLRYDDAATLLGISRSTVHSRMTTARRRLTDRFPHVRTLVRTES